jgi:SAM-dependent methyltransferase
VNEAVHADKSFRSFQDWREWVEQNKWVFDAQVIAQAVGEIAANGLIDPFYGYIDSAEVVVQGSNYRETIVARGLNSRLRAQMWLIVRIAMARGRALRVYTPEAVTSFSDTIAKLFPDHIGSEYLIDEASRNKLPESKRNIPHQDVMDLTFEGSSFDLYVSNEVMEHIPSIPRALSEARRILKTGGQFIATVPFRYMDENSFTKASIDTDGGIIYHVEPEYHGNPVDPGGSLVFTVPGWDIVGQCMEAGFAGASVEFISSRHFGVLGAEVAGIFILHAKAA